MRHRAQAKWSVTITDENETITEYALLTQLVECLLDVEKVSGSSPLQRTSPNLKRTTRFGLVFLCPQKAVFMPRKVLDGRMGRGRLPRPKGKQRAPSGAGRLALSAFRSTHLTEAPVKFTVE